MRGGGRGCFFVRCGLFLRHDSWKSIHSGDLPDIKSIHDDTLIFSEAFIILSASSSNTSPVSVSSITSIVRSARGYRRREASLVMEMRPRKASSRTIHPRRAYEMLSFQKERSPCRRHLLTYMTFTRPCQSQSSDIMLHKFFKVPVVAHLLILQPQ